MLVTVLLVMLSESTPESPACDLRAHTVVDVHDNFIDISANVQNLTKAPIEVVLKNRCPKGYLDYAGLPRGLDYHELCNRRRCVAKDEPPLTFTVEAGQWAPLPGFVLERGGRKPCQKPLAEGTYEVKVVTPKDQHRWCAVPATLTLAPPPKKKVDPADPYACEQPSDCTLSCPSAKGCCGDTCGCKHAINKRHAAAYEKNYAKTCRKAPCPAMGCAYEPAMGATCVDNRCQAMKGLGL
jgi:hypothetical protein